MKTKAKRASPLTAGRRADHAALRSQRLGGRPLASAGGSADKFPDRPRGEAGMPCGFRLLAASGDLACGGRGFRGGGRAEPRGDADAATAADRRGLLSRRDRRRAERGARRGGQGLPGPAAGAADRDRDAYRDDLAHRGRCRLRADRDGVGRQDGAAVVAARRQVATHDPPADRAGERRQGLCGGAFAGRPPPRGRRVGCLL